MGCNIFMVIIVSNQSKLPFMQLIPFRLLLTLILLRCVCMSHAQPGSSWGCGDEQLRIFQQRVAPGYDRIDQQNNLLIKEYADKIFQNGEMPLSRNGARLNNEASYVIPVVVHVIYPAGQAYGSGTNISYAQIRSQLEALNAAFSKNYPA